MNNEPVAWIALNQLNGNYVAFTNHQKTMLLPHIQQMYANWKPLYTHPAKTLTDEEIQEISFDFGEIAWLGDTTYEFARAILRKAQEQ